MSDEHSRPRWSKLAFASLLLGGGAGVIAFWDWHESPRMVLVGLPGFIIGLIAFLRIIGREQRLRGIVPALLGIVVSVCSVIAIAKMAGRRGCCPGNETNVPAALKGMTAHQAVFRRTDADGNGVQDYWTADVAGFYALEDSTGLKLQYIDVTRARADAKPVKEAYQWELLAAPVAMGGFLFKAMEKNADGKPYRQDPDGDGKSYTNLTEWAFCAYPERYMHGGINTYIVNEEGVVYRKNLGGDPVDQWPAADPTTLGWKLSIE